jgi:hypothetical protein
MAVVACYWANSGVVRTEDRNDDGRPDVWRTYDTENQLVAVAIDTNFDGRSDVHEYYDHGVLLRRELDRDFNDQIDLAEDFDRVTHDVLREIVDVNGDGSADLLVLFEAGQPVFSQWVVSTRTNLARHEQVRGLLIGHRDSADPLASLLDPFRPDTTVSKAAGSDGTVGLFTWGGLPASDMHAVTPATSASLDARDPQPRSLVALSPRSPRGPPPLLS